MAYGRHLAGVGQLKVHHHDLNVLEYHQVRSMAASRFFLMNRLAARSRP